MRFWTLDQSAIATAYDQLELTQPLTIYAGVQLDAEWCPSDADLSESLGLAGYASELPPHTVYVGHRCPRRLVSESLWHELGHAKQRELGRVLPLTHTLTQAEYGLHPLELEADLLAQGKQHFSLIKRAVAVPHLTYSAWVIG